MALVLGIFLAAGAAWAEKPPFRTMLSSDTTNIPNCPSPFRPQKGGPITDADIRASVTETAGQGIDVHMLQPGLGWVPWWPSQFLPMKDHVAWLESQGRKPDAFEKYVLGGGDMVRVFIDQCRASGEAPFISIRMNDLHHVGRGIRSKAEGEADKVKAMKEFAFFADHPEFRIGPGVPGNKALPYALDWGRPEVRDYKYRLLEELCRNYDFDGLELDFMRAAILFHPARTTSAERRQILTGFVKKVRQLLDETAKPGVHRWLCVRIPAYPETYDGMGIDLADLAAAGVDMVNASSSYFTDMQIPVAKLRKELPESAALYEEIHFATGQGLKTPTETLFRRSSREELETAAHLAYARGADGVSAFNFQYYRGTYGKTDVGGESAEPPYSVFKLLRDPAALSKLPQDYFWGWIYSTPYRKDLPLDKPLQAGKPQELTLDMAPPEGGWQQEGRLRVQATADLKGAKLQAYLNNVPLEPFADVSSPHPEYPVAVGKPEDYRAWKVPAALPKEGPNVLRLLLESGEPVKLYYLDVWLP
ncbi:MAG: hypothetical protein PW734_09710 [Verrucomicrobium sp.]|nr:hypothetical protein [Verrucomicrobium sp.]